MAGTLARVIGIAIATAAMIDTAYASPIPRQLFNKSVTVSWGESGLYKRESDGYTAGTAASFQVTAYISSAGRVFARLNSKSGSLGGTRQLGPENTPARFEGNSLVGIRVDRGIARRLAATFDSAYSSCSGSVTIGKIGPNAQVSGFDGAVWRVISMQPGAVSCSINDGNAFAR